MASYPAWWYYDVLRALAVDAVEGGVALLHDNADQVDHRVAA